MNRTILIVICDFLLVSLLAFSTVDINKVAEEGMERTIKVDIATNQMDNGKDLAAVMRLALDDERKNRDVLLGELTRSRAATGERDKQMQLFQQELQAREQAALRLQQDQSRLEQRFVAAQVSIKALNEQLEAATAEARLSKEKLEALELDARNKTDLSAELREQLAHLSRSNQLAQTEKQLLATQLQVAQVEHRVATEQVARMAEEVKIEREEKAKLAEGVKVLATRSTQLAEEIRESRPLTPNSIFSGFFTNRVEVRYDAFKAGFGSMKHKEAHTLLVTDGTNTCALSHVQDTPLALFNPGTDWEALTGTLGRDAVQLPIRSLSFCWPDPRVVWMPVSEEEARRLGCKIYRISTDLFRFQDAVLVGAQEGYYGECRFEIDPATPDYVKLDRSVLKGLFGKFNPSRGDLVFSKSGELLGIMANDTYCLVIRGFDAMATVNFGNDVRAQRTGETLSQLYAQLNAFPAKLQ